MCFCDRTPLESLVYNVVLNFTLVADCHMKTKRHAWACFLLVAAAATNAELLPIPPPPGPSPTTLKLDTSDLTSSLDKNVQAIGNLTASNERTVTRLQVTVNDLVDSNNLNVGKIVNTTSQLISKWDAIDALSASMNGLTNMGRGVHTQWETSMKPSVDGLARMGADAMQKWDSAMKPSIDGVAQIGTDALNKWDTSMKPSVDQIVGVADGALDRWDHSMKPSVDVALGTLNSTLVLLDGTMDYVKTTVFPLVLLFGTIWVILCFVGCLAVAFRSCCCANQVQYTSLLPMEKQGSLVGSFRF